MTRPHPIQPLELDHRGVLRFKANAIVRYLLDNGGIDMNSLAREEFSREDREQFAQLIGYSHSGSGDLSYVSDAVWFAAQDEYEARTDAESPAGTAIEPMNRYGTNSGHGHVWQRPDGVKARCGGPGFCAACTADEQQMAEVFKPFVSTPEKLRRLSLRTTAILETSPPTPAAPNAPRTCRSGSGAPALTAH